MSPLLIKIGDSSDCMHTVGSKAAINNSEIDHSKIILENTMLSYNDV